MDLFETNQSAVDYVESALVLSDLNVNELLNDNNPANQFDEMCDPDDPRVSNCQEISAAAYKIKSGILRTPCTVSNWLSKYF